MLFGSVGDTPTRVSKIDQKGISFSDREQASLAMTQIIKLYEAYQSQINEAEAVTKKLRNDREEAIQALFANQKFNKNVVVLPN